MSEAAVSGRPADDHFVFAFSDANFERYGITPKILDRLFRRHEGVNARIFFLASMEDEATLMAKAIPGKAQVCLDLRDLPKMLRQQFAESVARGVSNL